MDDDYDDSPHIESSYGLDNMASDEIRADSF